MKGNLIIISSPSGGGKGTLIREILASTTSIGYSVSYTTRSPREGEIDGRDYHFVSYQQFSDLIKRGEFLEYAEVHGNFYGTSKTEIARETGNGRDVILEIDVQGAGSVLQEHSDAVSIFIMPPSFEVLRERLVARATETNENLALRLRNSFGEIKKYVDFQFVVINDQKEAAVNDLRTIILSERLKRVRQITAVQNIIDSFDVSKLDNWGQRA